MIEETGWERTTITIKTIQTLFKTLKTIPEKADMMPGMIMLGMQILQQLILTGEIMPETKLITTTTLGVGAVIMVAITHIGVTVVATAATVGVLDFHGVAHGVGAAAGIWVGDIHLTGEDIIHIGATVAAITATVILIGDTADIMEADIGAVTITIIEEVVPTEEDLILITEDLPINMV
jgi:hypothetical protein